MRILNYLAIALTLVLSACSSYYSEPQEIEYDCILEKSQFLADMKQILLDEGFEVKDPDELRGYIVAEKNFKNSENEDVILNLSIRYNPETKKFYVSPSALELPRSENEIEYYTAKCMDKEYKPIFKSALTRMENFCKGGYFPNKP